MGERQVPVLDHVLEVRNLVRKDRASILPETHPNLPLHGDAEQRDEIHDQNWPEHRHVERLEERADDPDDRALADGVPELELR